MTRQNYELTETDGGVPIKAWTRGVPFAEEARQQLQRTAALPFVYKWVAVMPDVHLGLGATIGSVVATRHAIVPAAVGVDIGCGMMAVQTSLRAAQLPDNLQAVRTLMEVAVPHGRTHKGRPGDRGAWGTPPAHVASAWAALTPHYDALVQKHPKLAHPAPVHQLATLGTGNHFIELCLDEADKVWVMLHSGSRGAGNRIGNYFISLAKEEMRRFSINLPDMDLAYLPEGSPHFEDYLKAVTWAQNYAQVNRELMMQNITAKLRQSGLLPPFDATLQAVNCHHNYVALEHHYGNDVLVTRKGAVRARVGDMGIIPGSMGAKSFIVRGLGHAESFHSCSHGAGRVMSRTEARRRFTLADHAAATAGVECRKDAEVLDETPAAYKAIDAVMAAQRDLVEVAHTLRQVVCVKG